MWIFLKLISLPSLELNFYLVTVTWILQTILTPFTLYRYDHDSDKFSSLAICIKKNIHILHPEFFPSLNAVKFVITSDKEKQSLLLSFDLQ